MTTATVAVTPDFSGGLFTAQSASQPGVVHEQELRLQGSEIRVLCTCTAGRMARHGTPVPCGHARAVCELLEAHGLAVADVEHGRWVLAGAVVAA